MHNLRQRRSVVRASWIALISTASLASPSALALDYVTVNRGGREHKVAGRILVRARDGGLMIEGRDGVNWAVQPNEITAQSVDDTAFTPLSADELGEKMLAQLPPGFSVYTTVHYVVCYDTSRTYAEWCGALFERLYRGFHSYWSQRGFELTEPEFPLVAVVFADAAAFRRFSQPELGAGSDSIIGYYSLQTNRMTMFDLTGVAATRAPAHRTAAQINRLLAQPDAMRTVATVIHEATHQIAFNCGLHTRYADIPLWVCEGVAVYFETPDLGDRKGWRTIGAVNPIRLARFRQYVSGRPSDSLRTLMVDETRFRDPAQAEDAYAEAWALNYFLLKRHAREYGSYLERLAAKRPLQTVDGETRLAEFTEAMGIDLDELDEEFIRYMTRIGG